MAFTEDQFHRNCPIHEFLKWENWKITLVELLPHLSGANELTHWGRVTYICIIKLTIIGSDNGLSPIIPPASTKLKGGYTGITLSVCPSVRLWTESCSLCIFNNTHRIHFIFAHLIKQLQKVCRVKCPFQNSKFENEAAGGILRTQAF